MDLQAMPRRGLSGRLFLTFLTTLFFLSLSGFLEAKDYAKRFPNDTALEVYTPANPPPAGSESDPLSLHLNQSTPQTVLGGSGTGVKTYLTLVGSDNDNSEGVINFTAHAGDAGGLLGINGYSRAAGTLGTYGDIYLINKLAGGSYGDIIFGTNNTKRMTIKANGNVDFSSDLNIIKSGSFADLAIYSPATSYGQMFFYEGDTSSSIQIGGFAAFATTYPDANHAGNTEFWNQVDGYSYAGQGNIDFWTITSSSQNRQMRIANDGLVSIYNHLSFPYGGTTYFSGYASQLTNDMGWGSGGSSSGGGGEIQYANGSGGFSGTTDFTYNALGAFCIKGGVTGAYGGSGNYIGTWYNGWGNTQLFMTSGDNFDPVYGMLYGKAMRLYWTDNQMIFDCMSPDASTSIWFQENRTGTNVGIRKADYDTSDPPYGLTVNGTTGLDYPGFSSPALIQTDGYGHFNVLNAVDQALKVGGVVPDGGSTGQPQILSVYDATGTPYTNLGMFCAGDSTARGTFTVANAEGGYAWSANFMQFMVHGTAFANKIYISNAPEASDAGYKLMIGQGNTVRMGIGNIEAAPITFIVSNAGQWTINSTGGLISGVDGTTTQGISTQGNITGGSVIVGNLQLTAPGEIRFDGTHFYGYDGANWLQLDN